MEAQLRTTRPSVVQWWRWCNDLVDEHYRDWIKTPLLERGQIKVHAVLPIKFQPIEDWLFPRILTLVPSEIKDEVVQERVYGVQAMVVEVLFELSI